MPWQPKKPCRQPGCPELTDGRYCDKHKEQIKVPAWESTKTSSTARGYGHRWQKLRRAILMRDPICRACDTDLSVTVDHIMPKAQGGTDAMDNLQGLCRACHTAKTQKERQHGLKGRHGSTT